MKYLLCFALVFYGYCVFSQGIRVSSETGFSVTEISEGKKIMLHTGITVGDELNINSIRHLYFVVAVGGSLLRADYMNSMGQSVFFKNYFLTLPITLKKYYPISKRSSLFMDLGINSKYSVLQNKETEYLFNITKTQKENIGFNFGGLIDFGFKARVTPSLWFSAGIINQKDFLNSYKDINGKVIANQTSFIFSFYFTK